METHQQVNWIFTPGDQPDTSSATSEGRPREELPRNRHGPSTPEALAIVLRNSQRLLSGPAVSSLSVNTFFRQLINWFQSFSVD